MLEIFQFPMKKSLTTSYPVGKPRFLNNHMNVREEAQERTVCVKIWFLISSDAWIKVLLLICFWLKLLNQNGFI